MHTPAKLVPTIAQGFSLAAVTEKEQMLHTYLMAVNGCDTAAMPRVRAVFGSGITHHTKDA